MANLVHQQKLGDTFSFYGLALSAVDGTAEDLTGWTATSQIRKPDGTLVVQLIFAWLDPSGGAFRLYSDQDTSTWPLGSSLVDIQFTTDTGATISTPTFTVKLVEDVTL